MQTFAPLRRIPYSVLLTLAHLPLVRAVPIPLNDLREDVAAVDAANARRCIGLTGIEAYDMLSGDPYSHWN